MFRHAAPEPVRGLTDLFSILSWKNPITSSSRYCFISCITQQETRVLIFHLLPQTGFIKYVWIWLFLENSAGYRKATALIHQQRCLIFHNPIAALHHLHHPHSAYLWEDIYDGRRVIYWEIQPRDALNICLCWKPCISLFTDTLSLLGLDKGGLHHARKCEQA